MAFRASLLRRGSYDAIVLGGGVVGCATAFHLTKLGASVALVERASQLAGGATARSSACLRLHYSVPANASLANRALGVFQRFAEALGSVDADAGFVQSGHMIVGAGALGSTMKRTVENLAARGMDTRMISLDEARELHPRVDLEDVEYIGWEPGSGFADPYLTATSFVQAARQNPGNLDFFLGSEATGLLAEGQRILGVSTTGGPIHATVVVSCMNIWSQETVGKWLGLTLPVSIEKHHLIAVRSRSRPYVHDAASAAPRPTDLLPNVKCLTQDSQPYFRAYDGGSSVLVGDNHPKHVERVEQADHWDESVDEDEQLHCAMLAAHRFLGYDDSEIARSWSGCYDVSPDWNPVLGPLPGIDGLRVAFGFSGHGFKLSPVVGEMLAADALGETPVAVDGVDIGTYSVERFNEPDSRQQLVGVYQGAAS